MLAAPRMTSPSRFGRIWSQGAIDGRWLGKAGPPGLPVAGCLRRSGFAESDRGEGVHERSGGVIPSFGGRAATIEEFKNILGALPTDGEG
jgi:hypothetical protein